MFFKSKKLLRQKEEELALTVGELTEAKQQLSASIETINTLTARYASIINIDNALSDKKEELITVKDILADLNQKYKAAIGVHSLLEKEIDLYTENLETISFGLYQPTFGYESSEKYKYSIDANYQKQKELIKDGRGAVCSTEWTVSGSKAEGKKMTNQFIKLMLFAFNGECEGLIAKVKWNNAEKTKERIQKAFESINKLGVTQQVTITRELLALKLEELALTYECEQKKYEEKEEQRRIREQMREEEKAQRELERAQKEAEDEEARFQKALIKAKNELQSSSLSNTTALEEQVQLLEQKLKEAHEKKERALAMAQLTKIGHIYIISNLGSFGENVYKIGMTRRLDPLDRVKELGDASVPFQFDVHAIIYSEDAPQLEYELHQLFKDRRLNRVNHKKEFFKVTLDEIESFVNKHTNAEIEFTKLAEAREYRETMSMLEQLLKASVPKSVMPTKFPESLI